MRSLFLLALLLVPADAEIVLQTGHGANISALAFSSDGRYLVSASEDSTLKLWDPISGFEIRTLRGHSNIVTALAISKDSAHIASAALDHTLRVWNSSTGESEAVIRGPQPTVYLLKITPDGSSLVTAETVSAGTLVRVFDIKTGTQTRLIKRNEAAVSHIFFTGIETMLVAEESGEDDSTGTLTSYDLRSGRVLQTRGEVLCGASEDGRWIAIDRSTQATRRAVIVDLPNDKSVSMLTGQVSKVHFSVTGDWLAYESVAGDTAVVQRRTGGKAQTIHGRSAEFSMIAISPDGHWLASPGADYSVHIWDVESGKLAHGISGQYTPTALAFSADSKRLATNGGGTDLGSSLQLWDVEHHSQLVAPKIKHSISGLAFSKDGAYLAVTGSALEIFDAHSYRPINSMQCDSPGAPTFSPNGRWVAANCSGVVTIWTITDGTPVAHFGEHFDGPVVFSPDGRFLATAATKGFVLFDLASRKVAQTLVTDSPVSAIAFNASGELVAAGGGNSLLLFDLRIKRRLWSVSPGVWLSALKFQRDGRTLLAATGDDAHKAGSVAEIEISNGKTIRRLPIRVYNTNGLAISPNSEWVAVGSNSATHLFSIGNF